MESIYYVLTWLCHRTCVHCYEARFHPYYDEDLERVLAESRANAPRIIAHFPERMTYRDRNDPRPDGSLPEKTGQVILAGGEILLEPVRESVLYPAIAQLRAKYLGNVRIIVQTTGDLVTPKILGELRELGVALVSISGVDAFHQGLEEAAAREALKRKLTGFFQATGYSPEGQGEGPHYHFFGATPDAWIGRLWPRGRAWTNGLSTARLADNFCNQWSGGLGFLDTAHDGSEVSVEPGGNVYPCCLKTKLPVGNLLEDPLERILGRLTGDPVYEAISMGHPERMGIRHGWSVERFLAESAVKLADGSVYQNLCIGCDRFHEQVLAAPELVQITRPARSGT